VFVCVCVYVCVRAHMRVLSPSLSLCLLLCWLLQDKLVIKIKGDDAFANKIVDAAKSFPETAMLEKKPLYRTLGGHSGRRGRKPSVEKPEMATM